VAVGCLFVVVVGKGGCEVVAEDLKTEMFASSFLICCTHVPMFVCSLLSPFSVHQQSPFGDSSRSCYTSTQTRRDCTLALAKQWGSLFRQDDRWHLRSGDVFACDLSTLMLARDLDSGQHVVHSRPAKATGPPTFRLILTWTTDTQGATVSRSKNPPFPQPLNQSMSIFPPRSIEHLVDDDYFGSTIRWTSWIW